MRGLGTWLGGIGGAATIRRHKYCQDSHFDTEDHDDEDYCQSPLVTVRHCISKHVKHLKGRFEGTCPLVHHTSEWHQASPPYWDPTWTMTAKTPVLQIFRSLTCFVWQSSNTCLTTLTSPLQLISCLRSSRSSNPIWSLLPGNLHCKLDTITTGGTSTCWRGCFADMFIQHFVCHSTRLPDYFLPTIRRLLYNRMGWATVGQTSNVVADRVNCNSGVSEGGLL